MSGFRLWQSGKLLLFTLSLSTFPLEQELISTLTLITSLPHSPHSPAQSAVSGRAKSFPLYIIAQSFIIHDCIIPWIPIPTSPFSVLDLCLVLSRYVLTTLVSSRVRDTSAFRVLHHHWRRAHSPSVQTGRNSDGVSSGNNCT